MQKRLISRVSAAGVKIYSGKGEPALEETKKILAQFPGGSVDVKKDDKSGIATVCLNRPDKKNAIGGHMLLDLEKAAEELENWACGKGFILYGTDNSFSSGGDLQLSRATSTEQLGFALSRYVQQLSSRLKNLPLVSVALIEGVALGGGAEISVSACDWRIMAPDAKYGFVQTRMGLSPVWGGGVALKNLLGPSVALEIFASARLIPAHEALSIGLATHVLQNSENALDQTKSWLQERVHASVEVLRACKLIITSEGTHQEQLDTESMLSAPLWAGNAKLQALDEKIKHKYDDDKVENTKK